MVKHPLGSRKQTTNPDRQPTYIPQNTIVPDKIRLIFFDNKIYFDSLIKIEQRPCYSAIFEKSAGKSARQIRAEQLDMKSLEN